MAKVFFSYRRSDSAEKTKTIYRQFEKSFGIWRFLGAQRRNLFLDKDNIIPKSDFRAQIQRFIIDSDYMLVIIGDTWLAEIQRRQATGDADFVLIEIESAFIHGVTVIPVLIDGARMPSRDELPIEISQLATQHAHEIHYNDFEHDTKKLIQYTRPAMPFHLLSAFIVLIAFIGLGVAISDLLPELNPIPSTEIIQIATDSPTEIETLTPFDPVIASITAIFATSEAVNRETQIALEPTETELARQQVATETQDAIYMIGTNVAGSLTPPTTNTAMPPTLTPLEAALNRSLSFSGSNDDWIPFRNTFADDPTNTEMVLVPVGSFEMGSTEDEIDFGFEMCQAAADNGAECQRSWVEDEAQNGDNTQIFSVPFWIDQTEVTRAQYQQCIDAGECSETPDSSFSTDDNQPINRVTWFQAEAYCIWRDARLPSEAEWEYAARGVDNLLFPWGSEFEGTFANHCDSNCGTSDWASSYNYVNEENDDGFAIMSPVGSYPLGASWVGALDMSGNVWEWTNSLYEDYPYDASDGREDNTGERTDVHRVLRGGSFFNNSSNLRATIRYLINPGSDYDDFGFRCVRSY